jgi:hypothetical protein
MPLRYAIRTGLTALTLAAAAVIAGPPAAAQTADGPVLLHGELAIIGPQAAQVAQIFALKESDLTFQVPPGNGPVTGEFTVLWRIDLGTIDDAVGDALAGAFGGSSSQPKTSAKPCFVTQALAGRFEGTRSGNAVSGKLTIADFHTVQVEGCAKSNTASEATGLTGFTATYDPATRTLRGQIFDAADGPSVQYQMAFEAKAADEAISGAPPAPEPVSPAAEPSGGLSDRPPSSEDAPEYPDDAVTGDVATGILGNDATLPSKGETAAAAAVVTVAATGAAAAAAAGSARVPRSGGPSSPVSQVVLDRFDQLAEDRKRRIADRVFRKVGMAKGDIASLDNSADSLRRLGRSLGERGGLPRGVVNELRHNPATLQRVLVEAGISPKTIGLVGADRILGGVEKFFRRPGRALGDLGRDIADNFKKPGRFIGRIAQGIANTNPITGMAVRFIRSGLRALFHPRHRH